MIRTRRVVAAGLQWALLLAVIGCSDPRTTHIDPPDGGTPSVRTWPPDRTGYVNPIVDENALAGDAAWRSGVTADATELAAYLDRVSARAGDVVALHASSASASPATWILYRLGWYGGAGAREVARGSVHVGDHGACPMNATTGLVRCIWPAADRITLPEHLVSGLYALKLQRSDGVRTFAPLVVTDDRPADLLFQASVTTYQAYNDWGGASLYGDRTGTLPRRRAVEVGFDRPYAEGNGLGQMLRWEVHVARFLEQHGYDVSYTTNLDVSRSDHRELARRGAFLSVGHDEYWTRSQRDVLEAARDFGMSLLFFSANTAYWQVRLTGEERGETRVMVGWKEHAYDDPDQGPENTARFRDDPVARPENHLLGVMYDAWQNVRQAWVVADPDHFIYAGTGLQSGDTIPFLVGYESDRRFDNGADLDDLHVLARTPVVDVEGAITLAESTTYRARSGALVFASGTIEWANGLGAHDWVDPRVERMTANLIREAVGAPVPDSIGHGKGVPSLRRGPYASHVRTVARDVPGVAGIAVLPDGALAVTDAVHHRILRVSPSDGRVGVLAGGDTPGAAQPGSVSASAARFRRPTGIVADGAGNLFVADTGNHAIRKLRMEHGKWLVETIGGDSRPGARDGTVGASRFTYPMGIALDPATLDVLVADSWTHRIRRIQRGTWITSTVAGAGQGRADGTGNNARFDFPTGITTALDGTIFVFDSGSSALRKIVIEPATPVDPTPEDGTPGDDDSGDADSDPGDSAPPVVRVTTLITGRAGHADGNGLQAAMGAQGALVWKEGVLYVGDAGNHFIRRVEPGTSAASTQVGTFVGDGRVGLVDGPGEVARVVMPLGLAVGPDGTLFVADTGNEAIREVRQ